VLFFAAGNSNVSQMFHHLKSTAMTRDVSLNSQAWCDLVFNGKNRCYGAYEMRRGSSGRHLIATLIVTAAIVSALFAVRMYGKINAGGNDDTASMSTPVTMSVIDLSLPKPENLVTMEKPREVVKVKSSIVYTTVVIDKNARIEDEMLTMDNVNKSTAIVGHVNIDGDDDDPDAKDPNDVADPPHIIPVYVAPAVMDFAEIMPVYPGGDRELMRYLSENLKYPVADMEAGIHGRVQLRFIVGIDGSISDVSIVKSVSPNCDREAVRVVKSMTKWIPGRQNGKAVPVYFSLPVKFALVS
jgi:protein TonB